MSHFTAHPRETRVPGKVEAAQQYLYFAANQMSPPPAYDGGRSEPRDLSEAERRVYDAALEVLRLYFAGESDFADGPPAAVNPSDGDEPRHPAPV